MARRSNKSIWPKSLQRAVGALTRSAIKAGGRALAEALKPARPVAKRSARKAARKTAPNASRPSVKSASRLAPKLAAQDGAWIAGLALAPTGTRRYYLFKPADAQPLERLPLLVMLHGCGQDAASFALSTRMNRLAARERFLVLYPEQDRRANPQGCWNWFGTRSRAAHGEAAILLAAVRQVSQLYPVDPDRIAIAGLSAGASMAALMVTRYPTEFKALAMHSGVPPGAAESTMSALVAMSGRGRAQPLPLFEGTAWPPLLVIHGERDTVVAASNGRAAAELWAEAAGPHVARSRRVQRGQRHAMTITDFKLRGGRTVATLCAIDALDHAWSGGQARQPYSDAKGPDASRLIWAFAARQFALAQLAAPVKAK